MKKRILSIVLVLCMVLSFVPITVFAAGGDKTVSLGTDVIKNPTAPTASTDTWKGSYVYFGTYGGNPVKYRVLDKNTTVFGGTTMLLDCDSILWAGRNPSSAFDDNSNDWANSNIRTYLNGTFLTSNFSTAEQNAIASSTKSAEYSTDGNGWIGTLSYASLSNDKIFFLDAKEATNTSYGYSNNEGSAANREKTGGNASWWLRSAYTFNPLSSGIVYSDGNIISYNVFNINVGVSPALNINLSSVLFTSAAEGGKADTAVDGDLTAVSDYTGSEWKLTLLDSSRDSFSISGATVNNGTIRFSYSGAQTGTNEYISAVVVESGTITHYGRIFQLDGTTYGANGTASLSLPAGVTLSENTKLYVFNEQYNGDYQTDYASALKVVLPQETTPNATFTATGDNDGTLSNVDTSMKYSVDGGTTWNAVTGTTMDISSVTAEKDVKVYKPGNGTTTVDSEVQTIDVTQAVQPTGVDKADCTTSQQNDGQITGVDTTMEYRLSGTSGWTAVTVNPVTGLGSGSYEVRVKASGTVLASGTVIVTIGAHTCVAQGDWQHDGTGHWKLCACGAKIEEAAHSGDTASYFEKAACDYCHTEYGNLLTDTTAPTGEIAVGTNKWNSFLNTITFGLFFKDTQSVTITATDDSYDHAGFDDDKAVKVEYYLYSGDTALTKEDLASKEFTIYDGGFNINPDNKYVIYARLTDHAGNVTYISSNGIVLDSVVPVISGIENGKTYCEEQTFTVSEKYIKSVTVNGTEVTLDENNQFTLSPAEGTQTIVVTDKAGNETSVTVTVNDGHTAGNDDGDCSTPVYCIYHPDTVVVAAKSHDFSGEWQKNGTDHWHICQNDGCTVAETETPHSCTDDGDCTTAVICECGYVITAANAEHSYGECQSNGDGTHTRYCTVDGCSGDEDGDCEGGEASYFKKAVCQYCNEEYGNLLTDTTAPSGEISIDANKWNSFLNTITFGVFFKDTQSVTITASDDSYSHAGYTADKAVNVEYYLYSGDTALTKADLAGVTFTAYNSSFNINPDNKYVIYARLTDHAGNITYISSNGIVLDSVVPVISGVENGKTYCEEQTFTVSEKYIKSVTVNGTEVTLDENNQFTLSPAEGTQTIVITDKAGNVSAETTVTVNDGHTAGNDDGNCSTPVYCIYHPDTVVVAAKSHDFSGEWQKNGTDHWHICQNDGCTVAETETPHSCTDDGDCTTAVVCECGYVITAANAEHTYGEWQSNGDDTHTRYCTVDGCSGYEDGNCAGGEATCVAKAVCDTCKAEYGEIDSANHNLEKIPAKDATVTETGNTEYWHCQDCGKYFADENGTKEIKLEDTIISKLSPEIIEGKGQSITAGEKKELIFKSNAAFSDFIRVELDGKTLDEKNYTVKEGSTVVTLKADYVATLSAGEHTIGIVSESGTATTTFTVNAKAVVDNDTKSPQTGDNSHMALWIALLFMSEAGVIGTTVYGKKKRAK